MSFAPGGTQLIVSERATNLLDVYAVDRNGPASGPTTVASAGTTETAACWNATTGNGKFAYAGNAGTNDGALTLLDADGKTATAPAGVTDLATSLDSQSLYARLGDGSVGAWRIAADGSLSPIGIIGGLPRGTAGIAGR